MTPDSLFDQPVAWSGRPKVVVCPPLYRIAAVVMGVISAIATASAVVVAMALGHSPGSQLAFAVWSALLAVALARGPKWWLEDFEYVVTDRLVWIKRGQFRRTMDRSAISYARIHWDPNHPGVGDLELVRAVPTGALRRRLSIVLTGVVAPDRIWAIIRGITPATPAGDGERLLAQRLDDGERVLWSGHPPDHWGKWIPTNSRAIAGFVLGLLMAFASVFISIRAVHAVRTVAKGGMEPYSIQFFALVTSLVLTIFLMAGAAIFVMYASVIRPARLQSETRYWVTDRRVLIQCGDHELHLERTHIVDVIDSPTPGGMVDLFFVLDGPRARAFASSGAFGERDIEGLQPVFHRIAREDAETVRGLLKG
ncbi:MAG: hypothetical protein IPM54_14000 [Polyangiaceae bacterium]|nr:hypothetical protein [Polyangiaceae bacterium]